MEIKVKHPRYGVGLVEEGDLKEESVVTVFFEDKTFRRVHKKMLRKIRKISRKIIQ